MPDNLDFRMLSQCMTNMMTMADVDGDQHPAPRIAAHDVEHMRDKVIRMRFPGAPLHTSGQRCLEQIGNEMT